MENELCEAINCNNLAAEMVIVTCRDTGAHFIIKLCFDCYKDHQAAVLDHKINQWKGA